MYTWYKIPNSMNRIHNNDINKISECNLLYDIPNTSKRTVDINGHWYNILHGFMSTRKGRAKFKNFRILLDIVCSSTIVMIIIVEKLNP